MSRGHALAAGKDFDEKTGKLARKDVLLINEAGGARPRRAAEGQAGFESPRSRRSRTGNRLPRRSRRARCSRRPTASSAGPRSTHDEDRPEAVRERLDHVHAYRQRLALGAGRSRRLGAVIGEKYGEEFLPPSRGSTSNKVKNAQEAHEAIRPAGANFGRWMRRSRPSQGSGRAVRADLEAYGRVADGGCTRAALDHLRRGRGRALHRIGQDRGISRLSACLRRRLGRSRSRRSRPGANPPGLRRETAPAPRSSRRTGTPRSPRRAHGGDAGEGARVPRDRSAEHLREHHRDNPGARVRVQACECAGADVHGLRRDGADGAAPRRAGGLHVHRADGGRCRTRSPSERRTGSIR